MSKMFLVFLLFQLSTAAVNYPYGYNPEKREYSYAKYHERAFGDSIPKAWDWRDHGYVSPVKRQICNDCYIFSALEAIEGQWRRVHGVLNSLSEQNVLDCNVNGPDGGCDWGHTRNVYDFVKREGGIDAEATYPYLAKVQDKCYYNASIASVTGFTIINGTDEDLLHALATVGPIAIAVTATKGWHSYNGGISDGFNCYLEPPNHAVLLVGYGSENGVPFWIIKNSWGADWGEKGYIRLRRDIPDICGITHDMTYPNV